MDAFVISSLPSPMLETLQMAGPLRSADITPLHRYYGPSRHPLVFGRLPGFAGYTAYLAPTISRRDEEGFSSCLACPCHRAVASTPAGLSPAEHASLHWTHNRTCRSPASGSRTRLHAFTHDASRPSAVKRTSPKCP